MEDVMSRSGLKLARKNMEAYLKTHDPKYVAEDAVYINRASGERAEGKEAIGKMLEFYYKIAFEAYPKTSSLIVTKNKAMMEGFFIGKHIGEFAGIPATGKTVTVPFCAGYTLENGLIKEARIYMLGDVLMRQLQS
jgi:predicted ester cyclase